LEDLFEMSEKELKTLNLKLTRFKEDFKTYINTGGFPKVINDFFENNSISEETLNTYTNYLYVDIERFNRSRLILNQLLFKIPDLIGQRFTWNSLYNKIEGTGQMNLKPIKFKYFKEFFENKNIDLIKLYSLTGGIPKYVEILESKENIYDTIKENFLNVNSYLFEEPYFLLEKELKDIGSYFSIIKAIANGNNKLSKISTSLGIKQTSLSYYLNNLIELDILEREVPILEKNPQTSKKGIYKIKDNFLNFWFKFIYPYKSYIEIGNIDFVMNIIKKSFIERHVSFIYEDISKEKLIDLNLNDKLPVKLSKIGRWWDKNLEIDIVGVDRENKPILFGECKYTKKPVDLDVYYALVEKSKKLLKDNNQNNLYFAFFSYNGYTKNFIDKVKKEKNTLIFEGDLSENY